MNLTFNQKIAFAVAVFSFIAAGGSAADLVTLFGPGVAKIVAAAASMLAGIGGLFLGVVTGQASVVKDTLAMPGVESISVNAKANQTLAAIAIDPAQAKIDAAPGAADAVQKIAKGA